MLYYSTSQHFEEKLFEPKFFGSFFIIFIILIVEFCGVAFFTHNPVLSKLTRCSSRAKVAPNEQNSATHATELVLLYLPPWIKGSFKD
jgi:hypothetical protein